MKLRFPKYYKQFKCIANNCKDSCCSAGWEIDIDKETLELYKKVPREFGEKLNKNIDTNSIPHFSLDKNGKCPFFNKEKLCEIYLKLGKESLCNICTEHPRYYEYFEDVIEGGIGLCCEEAARIILSETSQFSTYEIETKLVESDSYNVKLYKYLCTARQKIISYLENESLSLNSRIRNILWFSYTIQQNIDNNLLDDENIFEVKSYTNPDIKPIFEFLFTLEHNNPNWITYLEKCINTYSLNKNKINEFENTHPQISNYLKNIAIYFIWRYFLKGAFDEDVLSKVKLMVVSIAILKILFFCKYLENQSISLEDCIYIAKKYSEEIEYSEDNLYSLADASYNLEIFDTENLLGLFNEIEQ